MPKASLDLVNVPDIETIKQLKFGFIDDDVLQTNLSITMQHITFLVVLDAEYDLPGTIKYSLPKELIVLTACIIEAVIHFTIKKIIDSGKFTDEQVLGRKKDYSTWNKLWDDPLGGQWGTVKLTTEAKTLKDDVKFQDLNTAAKRCQLFDDAMFGKVQSVRDKRNRIHLMGLQYKEDTYSKSEAEEVFIIAKDVIKSCEDFLKP